jgi:hypothetical protein
VALHPPFAVLEEEVRELGNGDPAGLGPERRRGVDERAIRKHVKSGLLAEALTPNRKIIADVADRILATALTKAPDVPPVLADARKRKLVAQVAAIEDEVAAIRNSLIEAGAVRACERAIALFFAESFGPLVKLGSGLAGVAPPAAFAKLTDAVHDTLTAIATADITFAGRPPDAPPPPPPAPPPPDLGTLDAVGLAARKADLEAERLELSRQKSRGELLDIEAEERRCAEPVVNSRTAALALPHRTAPLYEHLTKREARALLKGAVVEVVSHFDVVTLDELRAAVDAAAKG